MKTQKSKRNSLIGFLIIILVSSVNATAQIVSYDLLFSGDTPPDSGSFTFNTETELFTAFSVISLGTELDLLSSANSPVTQNGPPFFTPLDLFEALTTDIQYQGFDLVNGWSNYPPNPPGNLFVSSFAIQIFNTNSAGAVIGAEYPGDITVTGFPSGTFTVSAVPEPATVGLLFGICMLGFSIARRKNHIDPKKV